MRVLMVTPGFYPIKGGTETVVQNLSIELSRIGVQVDVMTFNMDQKWNPKWRGKTEKIAGLEVFKIPALNWLPTVHSPRITFGINLIPGRFSYLMKKYDIIHFHEADFSFPLFSLFEKKPKIMHLHSLRTDHFERYYFSRVLLRNLADFYISITQQMKKELTTIGIPQERITYLPNSVNTKIFYPKQKIDNVILYVGRIAPEKGLHILLRSLIYVERSVHLVIIGPLDWSSEYCQQIMSLIKNENSKGKHRIEYLGRVDQEKLIHWHQQASIFVLPSIYEPFGIVLLEAMSCETPVIGTYTGGIPEIIQNGKNGILVPVNDPVRLGDAIEYLLENKDVRLKFGKAGRRTAVENFSIDIIAKKLGKIYEKIIDN